MRWPLRLPAAGEAGPRRSAALLLALVLALWTAWTLPLALGNRTLILRDVVTTHLPYKAFGAAELAHGSIPAVNPTWNLGQPYRGNPNALAFYPTNLLYLAVPFGIAFNLHYALHWLIGFFGMRALARALGQSEMAALFAAVAWSGSGYFLSLLTFYNLVAVGAWAPWILVGLARGGRRGIALAGLALGLALLGGEPVTTALLFPAMLLVALEGRTWKAALGSLGVTAALGALVALPQIVATARVSGFTFRAAHGLADADAGLQSFHPLRLLEIVLPLPWGWPADLGRFGYWSDLATPFVPYVYSIHFGVVAAIFAGTAFALRARRRYAALATLALALAWAGGISSELTARLTLGLFRYPQKLLVLFALAAALLAGWGLDRAIAARRAGLAPGRPLNFAGAILLAVAGALFLFQGSIAELLRARLASHGNIALAQTATAQWTLGAAFAGLLLLGSAWALARERLALVVVAELAGLFGLAPALVTDATSIYRDTPPLAQAITPPRALVALPILRPEWEPPPPYRLGRAGIVGATRLAWQNVEPAFGVPRGITYPIAPDLEGMTSPLTVLVLRNLPPSAWAARRPWLERFGAGWVLRAGDEPAEGLDRVAVADHWGVTTGLDRVAAPAPFARWPAAVEVAESPIAAYARIASAAAGIDTVVASRQVEHHAGAAIVVVEERPDRIVVDVAGDGGLLALTRAWLPIYRARLSTGERLATQPVDVALLGVEVPAGERRVVVDVSSAPEVAAGIVALAVGAALLVLVFRRTA